MFIGPALCRKNRAILLIFYFSLAAGHGFCEDINLSEVELIDVESSAGQGGPDEWEDKDGNEKKYPGVILQEQKVLNTNYTVYKLDAGGNLEWVREYDAGYRDTPVDLGMDKQGNIYLAVYGFPGKDPRPPKIYFYGSFAW